VVLLVGVTLYATHTAPIVKEGIRRHTFWLFVAALVLAFVLILAFPPTLTNDRHSWGMLGGMVCLVGFSWLIDRDRGAVWPKKQD